jgi:hypothetical protein
MNSSRNSAPTAISLPFIDQEFDFAGALSSKFNEQHAEEESIQAESLANIYSDDEDGELSDSSVDQKLRPGVRDKQTAALLRIHHIERKLATCKSLSKKQRRALQARKNTAIFRERRRQTLAYQQLFDIDLPEIALSVSVPSKDLSLW